MNDLHTDRIRPLQLRVSGYQNHSIIALYTQYNTIQYNTIQYNIDHLY